MRRLSKSAYGEVYHQGSNQGFVVTPQGVLMVDTPERPIQAVKWREKIIDGFGPIRHLVNTHHHGDHIAGNFYFPGVEVIGHELLPPLYDATVKAWYSPERLERMKQIDPDSVWLVNHPAYPPNPPTRLYRDRLDLVLGDVRIEIMHFPGHTPEETHVYLPDERVMFTGDNIFYQSKIYLQDCDPWQQIESIRRMESYDVEVFVPGHGEYFFDKRYLQEEITIIESWISFVEGLVKRGLSLEEALKEPVSADVDPYAPGQGRVDASPRINDINVRNLYRRVKERESAAGV